MPNLNPNWNYDEAFAALETVLAQLEGGDLPLEQTLALYEEGIALANLCARKLEDAELRVRKWQGVDNGGLESVTGGDQTGPFDGWQDK
jgi:exodeoxyribonuclease VII small subunit